MIKSNEKSQEILIDNLAFGGNGVGTLPDGMVCFVPGTIPGEKVLVQKKKEKETYVKAELLEVLESSPHRIDPVCPLAYRARGKGITPCPICPGCAYQHINYEEEVKIKNLQLQDCLERIAGLDAGELLSTPQASPKAINYRNKIKLHAQIDRDMVLLGYFLEDNCNIIAIQNCPLAHPEINAKLEELNQTKGFTHSLRDGMNLTIRHTEPDGIKFWRNKADKKASWLKEQTALGTFSVPMEGFFQVNPHTSNLLLLKAKEYISTLNVNYAIDLYCGAGTFSIAAAEAGVSEVTGIDSDQETIEAAKYNASSRGYNCSFQSGDAKRLFPALTKKITDKQNLLIVDPPRNGLSRQVRQAINSSKIQNLIYISCAPDTLSRDLKELCSGGGCYQPVNIQLFDMFPRTPHFESITFLERI
jgi:tRNA/tmRNA/rRNA uracil-C5-methylase (TrmA/RlmC/RlmD family)